VTVSEKRGQDIAHYYNEIDPFCCKVLRARIADGSLPFGFVDERDIREVSPADLDGFTQCHFFAGIGGFALGIKWGGAERLPLWTGGFPCQDISMAGDRAGLDGERSGLWHGWFRLIRASRPEILIVENTSGLLIPIDGKTPAPIARVLADLAACGFAAEWESIPASTVGAPHERDRVWIVAHDEHRWLPQRRRTAVACEQGQKSGGVSRNVTSGRGVKTSSALSDAFRKRLQGVIQAGPETGPADGRIAGSWDVEPAVGRVVHGVPNRVDRIRALGNAVVPQVVEAIARALINNPHVPLTPKGE